jgi:hypothetical protein
VILALCGLAFQVAKKSTKATDQALVMSVLLSKVDKSAMIPFDSLGVVAGCDTTISGTVKVIGCITVVALTARLDSVRVTVQTTVPATRPETVFMRRTKAPLAVPLR